MHINGKKVVDAKAPLRISISKQDAKSGKNKDPAKCAAANAIVRTIADAKSARVHLYRNARQMGALQDARGAEDRNRLLRPRQPRRSMPRANIPSAHPHRPIAWVSATSHQARRAARSAAPTSPGCITRSQA